MTDKIDEAVAAVEQAAPVQMTEYAVRINSTGREFHIQVPIDMTDAELVEATGWMLTYLSGELRKVSSSKIIPVRSFLGVPSK